MNRKSRILERFARGGAADGSGGDYDFEYPPYLAEEYEKNYICSAREFNNLVVDEVESCRIDISKKNNEYKLWFGKYKGKLLYEIDDLDYLDYLCNVCRNKHPSLVGQLLLRMDELKRNL
jgi:uncharacterized protein (DUF3820 family)